MESCRIPFIIFLTVFVKRGVDCDYHGNRRFLFDATPATQTTPDLVFLSTEVKYLQEQLHQLSDRNTHLFVQNSILSSQVQSQTAMIRELKTNLTNSENLCVSEKANFTAKINKLSVMLNDSKVHVGELTLNTTSCLLQSEQLKKDLNVSNDKVNQLNNKLDELSVAQNSTVQAAVQECHKNESDFAQLLLANISSLQLNCSRQHTLLTEHVSHLEVLLNNSASLVSSLESNWTACVNNHHQLQGMLNASQQKNHLLDHLLSDIKLKKDNLSLALLQCEEKNQGQ